MPNKVYLVTGSNSGLGLEAVKQLALIDDTKKVYLACRSADKAKAAIQQLADTTNVQIEKLQYVNFDASKSKQDIDKALSDAIPSLEPLDGAVLNAGGFGHDATFKPTGPNNVLETMQINVLGHVHLVDALQKRSLLKDGCHVINVGSEGARGIPGVATCPTMADDENGVEKIMGEEGFFGKKPDPMVVYAHAKGLSALYFAAWARENTQYYVLTVSPGAVNETNVMKADTIPWMARKLLPLIALLMKVSGMTNSLDVGAKRYVDAVTGVWDKEYPTGTFVASKVGTSGPVCDQTKVKGGEQYASETKRDAAYSVIQKYL